MPMRDAIFNSGMICPVSVGKCGMFTSQTCVDLIRRPSGRLTVSGFIANLLLSTPMQSMMKMDVAPVSATARFGAIVSALMDACGHTRTFVRAVFEMMTVSSSLLT